MEHLPSRCLAGGAKANSQRGVGLGDREGSQVVERWWPPADPAGRGQDGGEGGEVQPGPPPQSHGKTGLGVVALRCNRWLCTFSQAGWRSLWSYLFEVLGGHESEAGWGL